MKSRETVVKVQLPLASNVADPPVLVYDEHRTFMADVVADQWVIAAMRGRPKAYFTAQLYGDEIQILKEVPDPGW